MRPKRNLSIDAELNELFDWQHKARLIGYLASGIFLVLNLAAWSAELIPQHDTLKFGLLSALFCFGGYFLYRLNFHLERLVIHTLVIRKELGDLEGELQQREVPDRPGAASENTPPPASAPGLSSQGVATK